MPVLSINNKVGATECLHVIGLKNKVGATEFQYSALAIKYSGHRVSAFIINNKVGATESLYSALAIK